MQKDRSPSIAVIGCGYWGKNLVRNFSKLNALALCCDATPAGRALAAELAPEATVVSDIGEVFESEVDGVVIATPAETHYDLARAYHLNNQDDQAKDELLAALETAPGYRQAQKLLLELSETTGTQSTPIKK